VKITKYCVVTKDYDPRTATEITASSEMTVCHTLLRVWWIGNGSLV